MKNTLILFICVMAAILPAACAAAPELPLPQKEIAEEEPPVPLPENFPGKIAILTNTAKQHEEAYYSAESMVKKYGEDKILHITLLGKFMGEYEYEATARATRQIAADTEVKALTINWPLINQAESCALIDKLRETRDDIFIIFVDPSMENPPDVAVRADLILASDDLSTGRAMVQQAHKVGAKTFVHYSFPRHMASPLLSSRRDLIKEECAELGIEFMDAAVFDWLEVGEDEAQQFISEDVPKMIAKYGKDTAFFATNCNLQPPLIKAVADNGAIYPQPCCPSPYHGFPAALGITVPEEGLAGAKHLNAEIARVLAEKNMTGRVSTWPDTFSAVATAAGVEYAIKRINGEVPKEGLDVDVLKQLMEEYAGVEVFLTPYTDEYPYTDEPTGETFGNYLLVRMGYITY